MDNIGIKSSKGFFVGDVTDVLSKEVNEFWETVTDFSEGVLEVPGGYCFAVACTMLEEGTCSDDYGNEYFFEGCFGVVPLELTDKESDFRNGEVFLCPGTVEFEYNSTEFTIALPDGRILHIDTMED